MSRLDLISVVIPTYNMAHFLIECIQSVFDQTWSSLEIIIVDDGSTDNTSQIIKELGDDRIRYFYCGHSGRIGEVREFGIDRAHGDFIAFLDSDDVWMPTKLKRQMDLLTQYPEALFCVSHGEQFGEGAVPPPKVDELFVGNLLNAQLIDERFVLYQPTLIFRREAMSAKGVLNNIVPSGDTFFVFRLAALMTGIFTAEILVKIRKHETNISKTHEVELSLEHIDLLKKLMAAGVINASVFRKVASKQYYKIGLLYQKRFNRKGALRAFAQYTKINPLQFKGYARIVQSLLN